MKLLILKFNRSTNKWEKYMKIRKATDKTIEFYCNLGYVCQHIFNQKDFNMPNRRSFLNTLN